VEFAATIRGNSPDDLLDSYTTERHPVGARILDWTRAQVALMRPSSRALQAVVRDLISLQALDGLGGDNLRYVASDARDRLGLAALLVRPDGFVAWASDTTPSPEEVKRAAARWFTV
jgi:2-polyprenyl-6-methoxyphenol hydroxylase-like FAD-dependent oxidoreductase